MAKASAFLLIVITLSISACATNPDKIDAAYVSPLKYKNYDCDQIALEMDYIGQRTNKIYQRLEKERNADNWQMGVGLLVFWPALFFLEGGDGPEAAEYAQLKGEFEALRSNSVEKKCGIEARSPDEIIEAAQKEEKNKAIKTVDYLDAKHVDDVREIAENIDCRKVVKLMEVTEDQEIWELGCADGRVVKVSCEKSNCYTREDD